VGALGKYKVAGVGIKLHRNVWSFLQLNVGKFFKALSAQPAIDLGVNRISSGAL
jgi:hypothetical protein